MPRLNQKFRRRSLAWLGTGAKMLALALAFFGARALADDDLPPGTNWVFEATNHLGQWVWDSKTFDKQTCRFWNEFEVPRGTTVSKAIIRITVDNGYRLFLDGREIGRGSDWRTVTVYDVKWLLSPGKHVVAVEAFNDRLAGGLIFDLDINLVDQNVVRLVSDTSWRVVPLDLKRWETQRNPSSSWPTVTVVGNLGSQPWNPWPYGITREPPLQPITLYFWQTVWFQALVLILFGLAVLACLWLLTQLAMQSRAQRLLQLQRARIARDIHDDLGARLTQLVLLGELAQSELPAESSTRRQIDQICDRARDLGHAMDEVVWAVSSRRDTLRDFATYVCKYAQLYLKDTPVRCRLDVEMDLPPIPFDLAIRRNLLLAVKEAIGNVAKHSGASEMYLRIHRESAGLRVIVEDDGHGFEISQADPSRNGLLNMAQRMAEVGGELTVATAPGAGCRINFHLPLTCARQGPRWLRRFFLGTANVSELDNLPVVANREAELTEIARDET